MFVPVCDRPSVAEPTEAQDRAVMETKSATIHRKMPMSARQLPITGSAHKAGVVGDAQVRAGLAALVDLHRYQLWLASQKVCRFSRPVCRQGHCRGDVADIVELSLGAKL